LFSLSSGGKGLQINETTKFLSVYCLGNLGYRNKYLLQLLKGYQTIDNDIF